MLDASGGVLGNLSRPLGHTEEPDVDWDLRQPQLDGGITAVVPLAYLRRLAVVDGDEDGRLHPVRSDVGLELFPPLSKAVAVLPGYLALDAS